MNQEIGNLAARYGAPRQVKVTVPVGNLDFSAITARPERVAEVVFAIRRPNGRLITQTKSQYPADLYRLPSGSITQGESIEAALQREVAEETSLQTEILRFLAIIRYTLVLAPAPTDLPGFRKPGRSVERSFTSYVFLLQEVAGQLYAADADEQVAGFRESLPAELPALADALESLAGHPDPAAEDWGDWGRFRAVTHRVVWEALNCLN